MKNSFELDLELKHLKSNSYYQGIVQNLYSGSEGAITMLLQFVYDGNVLSGFSKSLAKTFYNFAQDELKNQYILSQIILMLGGDPLFINAQGKWFGGRNIDYVKNIEQILCLLIETKEKIILDYHSAISKIDDLEIKKYLNTILLTEKEHHCHLLKIKKIYS